MSNKIDERVVSMKFNSDKFEKGVEATTSALDGLKDALKLENIDSNLEKVASKFNVFGAIGLSAIHKLVGGAIDAGMKIGNAMWEPLVEGGRKRALNLEQARFQFKNLGVDVVAIMADVDYAVQGTAYSLDSAARAAASLSASQVAVGDDMKTALRGISGVAALTGQEYDRVADIFTKVAGQGRVMGGELQQLNQLGFNAAATLTDYMNEMGITTNATQADIRAMASESKISFDIFAKAMDGAFGENATAANETYTGSLANMRGALARIGALHFEGMFDLGTGEQIFAGHLERQRDLFNSLRVKILEVRTALVPLFHVWSDMQGLKNKNLTDFIDNLDLSDITGALSNMADAVRNVWNAFNAIVNPIKAAWKEVFPPKATTWMTAITKAIADFTSTLVLGAAGGDRIKGVFILLFSVLKTGMNIVGGILSVVGTLVVLLFRLLGAIIGLITPIVTFFTSMFTGAKSSAIETKGFFDIINNFLKGGLGPMIEMLKKGGAAFNEFLNGEVMAARVKTLGSALKAVAATIAMIWNVLTKGDFTENPFFSEDSKFVGVLFKIREAIIKVVDAFKTFGKEVALAGDRAATFWGGVGTVIKNVWNGIKSVASGIGKFLGDIFSGVDTEMVLAGINAGALVALTVGITKVVKNIMGAFSAVGEIKKSFIGALDSLSGALGRFQKETNADKLLKIAAALIILAGALWILSTIEPQRLINAVTAMATSFGILLGGLAILDKIKAGPSLKASATLTLIALAMILLASAVQKLGDIDPDRLAGALAAVAISMGVLVGAAKAMSTLEGDIVKSSAALIIMAGAVVIMAGAVALFGMMPMEMLMQGMISMVLVLGALVGAAVLLSKFAPQMVLSAVGLMAMAAAIGLLLVPITALGLLPFPILLQGMATLGILLAGLVGFALLLGLSASGMVLAAVGLLAMAGAINLLVGPIIALGMLPMDTLIQGLAGLAAVMAVMVIAALAMAGATVGIVGMVAMAAAILILSVALAVLAGIGMEGIATAIVGLVAAIIVLALTAAILTPLIPVMAGVAAVMALFGLGALALAAAMMVMSIALMLMGPGLTSATQGLMTFAAVAPKIMEAVPAMLAVGAGLLVFGAGALIAGAGALVLGAGLVLLGAGLAILAAVGILGAYALVKVAEAAGEMLYHVPGMLGTGAAFLVLGAGALLLGAGLLVLAAGALLVVVALAALVPLGALVTVAFGLIIKAIEKLIPMTGSINTIAKSLGTLGASVVTLANSGRAAASGLLAMTVQFALLSAGALLASNSVRTSATSMTPSMAIMLAAIAKGPAAFQAFATAVVKSMSTLNAGLNTGASQAEATATRLGRSVGALLVNGISSSYGGVYNSSVTLGDQMIAGMNQGLQNGSPAVSRMAAQVARTALDSAKRTLGVASPAKELIKVGEYYDEGFVGGMENNLKMVEKAGTKVGTSALSATQKALVGLKKSVMMDMNFDPTIRPVLDLSAIRKDSGFINDMLTPMSLKVDDSYAMASSLARQQRAAEETMTLGSPDDRPGSGMTLIQNNYSPKALTSSEIYRNTKNLISVAKGELTK